MPGSDLRNFALTTALRDEQLVPQTLAAMISFTRLIEEYAVAEGLATLLIVSLPRLGLYRLEQIRYERLARQLAEVIVLTVPEGALPTSSRVRLLSIEPGWPLAREWAVIARSPRRGVALLGRVVASDATNGAFNRFRATWVTDLALIDPLVLTIRGAAR